MKISIIGLGYIGLPTATMFASKDIEVVGVDINQEIVDTLNSGNIHIVEPGLEPMVKQLVNIGKLRASTDVERSDVFIIAVPTPFKDKHEPDLYFVETAAMAIAPFLQKGNLVIIESTSPVGTTQQISMLLQKNRSDLSFPKLSLIDPVVDCDVFIAYCPERVLPGKIMHELVKNDRKITFFGH